MKTAVIDVGSNSVRLMFSENGRTVFKKIQTTKLASKMKDGVLDLEAVERTVRAVSFFVNQAKELVVDNLFVFATAAVRKAKNKQLFIDKVFDDCAIKVDVISGQLESEIGAIGALNGTDGAIIDIGGASSEIAVVKNGNIVYSKSLDVGAVTLTDKFGQNKKEVFDYLQTKLDEYGNVVSEKFLAIGGTATTAASVIQQLKVYDSNKTDGFVVKEKVLFELVDKLYLMSIEDRKKLDGLQPERAEIIPAGLSILLFIIKKLKIDSVTVSEKDNLEGYLIKRGL